MWETKKECEGKYSHGGKDRELVGRFKDSMLALAAGLKDSVRVSSKQKTRQEQPSAEQTEGDQDLILQPERPFWLSRPRLAAYSGPTSGTNATHKC